MPFQVLKTAIPPMQLNTNLAPAAAAARPRAAAAPAHDAAVGSCDPPLEMRKADSSSELFVDFLSL